MKKRKHLTAAQTKVRKKLFLEYLEKNLGILTPTCKGADIDTTTYYNWYYSDMEFKAAVDNIQNVAIDFVESKLMQNIKNGDKVSIIFYLKCKAKDRGYVEQQNFQIDNRTKIEFSFGDEEELKLLDSDEKGQLEGKEIRKLN